MVMDENVELLKRKNLEALDAFVSCHREFGNKYYVFAGGPIARMLRRQSL